MDKISENRFNRDQTVLAWLNENATVLTNDVPEIGTVTTDLQIAIDKVSDESGDAQADTTGITEDKAAQRTILENKAFHVAAGISSWALKTKNRTILRMFDYTISDLKGMSDSKLLTNTEEILDKANEAGMAANILPFKVTAQDITDLGTARTDFKTLRPKTRLAVVSKTASLEMQDIYLKEADLLIENLVTYMKPFRQNNLELYTQFQSVILITDNAATHSSTPDATGTLPVLVPTQVQDLPDVDNPATASIRIEVYGIGFSLQIYFAANPVSPMGLQSQTVSNGETKTFTTAQLGFDPMLRNQLILFNNSVSPVSYKIWVIEG